MNRHNIILSVLPLMLLAGCYPTRIVTVAPYNTAHQPYSTTIVIPKARTVTTTTNVTPTSDDISLYLDLQAVGAAFAQSDNIQEFESLLNNSSYIISNLDLNADGYVDYLRVVEQMQGYNHVYIIQAVLGANIYQDVATLVAEVPSLTSYHVQVIGAPYIYGPNYYIDPIFISRPPIIAHICRPSYRPWTSPWYWNHFPSYYKRPAPLHPHHYHAYVHTYMTNHSYCHSFEYASHCHYVNFSVVARPAMRSDYERMHPEKTFTTRTANMPEVSRQSGANARTIRDSYNASMRSSTTSTASRSAAVRQATSAASRQVPSEAGSSTSAASRQASSGSGSSTSAASRQASSGSGSSTSAASRQASSGSGSSTSAASRQASSGSGSSTSAASRQASSGSGSSTSAASRQASSGSGSGAASTTVQSRVSNSGTTNTKIRTVTPSGSQSTVNRNSSSSSSSRSSAPTSSSRSSSSSSSRSSSSLSSTGRSAGTSSTRSSR